MRVDTETLAGAAEIGARRLALGYVDEADAALGRLADPSDVEALHDLRVAIRRLRSAVRAYRDALHGGVGKKARRWLREIARATGAARDAEVLAERLRDWRGELGAADRSGAEWLLGRLDERKRSAYATLRSDTQPAIERVLATLRERLEVVEVKVHVREAAPEHTFAETTARLIRVAAAEMRARLAAVRGIEDEAHAHDARIAGKRLRYLLEPLRGTIDEAKPVLSELKEIQDALGDLHDLHVLAAEVAALEPESESVEAGALAGIARRARAEAAERFAAIEARWLGDASGEFFARVERLAARLESLGKPGVEIERKYLLRALPDAVRGARAKEIDQGYLPGERLRERVRREREGTEERFWRTVKLGKGVQRIEVEEAASREVFDALWALTHGARVRKRRYLMPAGERTWEIDDFLDRSLVLAEIELGSPDEPVTFPEWLAPYVEREVTEDSAYVNLNLAK